MADEDTSEPKSKVPKILGTSVEDSVAQLFNECDNPEF